MTCDEEAAEGASVDVLDSSSCTVENNVDNRANWFGLYKDPREETDGSWKALVVVAICSKISADNTANRPLWPAKSLSMAYFCSLRFKKVLTAIVPPTEYQEEDDRWPLRRWLLLFVLRHRRRE